MVFDYPVWSSLNVGQLLDCSHSFLALKLHVSENDTPFLNSLGRLLIWAFQYSQCTTHQCSGQLIDNSRGVSPLGFQQMVSSPCLMFD
jgi:hypothetical protein